MRDDFRGSASRGRLQRSDSGLSQKAQIAADLLWERAIKIGSCEEVWREGVEDGQVRGAMSDVSLNP